MIKYYVVIQPIRRSMKGSTLRLLSLAGRNFSVLVVCSIWQVLILAFFFLMISYVFSY